LFLGDGIPAKRLIGEINPNPPANPMVLRVSRLVVIDSEDLESSRYWILNFFENHKIGEA
jgi:hypothetical protein